MGSYWLNDPYQDQKCAIPGSGDPSDKDTLRLEFL